MWQSKKKKKESDKTQVDFKDVTEISFGQRTEKFKKNNRPDLEHLSFSIVYNDGNVRAHARHCCPFPPARCDLCMTSVHPLISHTPDRTGRTR